MIPTFASFSASSLKVPFLLIKKFKPRCRPPIIGAGQKKSGNHIRQHVVIFYLSVKSTHVDKLTPDKFGLCACIQKSTREKHAFFSIIKMFGVQIARIARTFSKPKDGCNYTRVSDTLKMLFPPGRTINLQKTEHRRRPFLTAKNVTTWNESKFHFNGFLHHQKNLHSPTVHSQIGINHAKSPYACAYQVSIFGGTSHDNSQ